MNLKTRIITLACSLAVAVASVTTLAAEHRADGTAPPHSRGAAEGIQVHGAWTITIRNADGSVESRHDFQNHLATTALLAKLLKRDVTSTGLVIIVSTDLCNLTNALGTFTFACLINEPSLAVTLDGSDLVLRGSTKAQNAGAITFVATGVATSTGDIINLTERQLTNAEGSSPAMNVHVDAQQTIDVQVRLSFS
jgi:hypothetical protein